MWKLFILTFLYFILITSCTDDTSGDVKTTLATAAVQIGSSPDGNSGSAAALEKLTSVKTKESSGTGNSSNSSYGSYEDESYSEEDDDDNYCNVEERDDDYDCTSAMSRVHLAIIRIDFIRKNYYLKNNFVKNNNYCDMNKMQGYEGHVGSPLSTWYILAMTAPYTKNETLYEILRFIGLKNKDECRCVMVKMRQSIKPFLKDYYYYSAAIMQDNKDPFDEEFKIDTKVYLNGIALNTNFTDSQASAKIVNKYTAAQTGYLVKHVVSKKEASTVFNAFQNTVNVVASYLKLTFKMALNTKNKTKGIYYGLNEPTITEYMYQDVIYNFTDSRTLESWIFEIELKNKNTKVVVIFPKTRCGLQSVVAKLASEPQILVDEMKCLKPTRLLINFPVYKSFTYVENVVPALKSTCEIDRVFNKTEAQIIDSCGKLINRYITYIHEKATAMLSSLGTEPYKKASASDCPECGDPIDICVNYPALFHYYANDVLLESVIGPVVNV